MKGWFAVRKLGEALSGNPVDLRDTLRICGLFCSYDPAIFVEGCARMPSEVGGGFEFSRLTTLIGTLPHTAGKTPCRILRGPIFI